MTDEELTPAQKFEAFVGEVLQQEDFSDEHIDRIHAHARSVAEHIRAELDWAKTAHVHNTVHSFREDPAKDTFRCHDCGRALINDVGTEPLLVCPKLQGRRPPLLRPKKANGAVECGQAGI